MADDDDAVEPEPMEPWVDDGPDLERQGFTVREASDGFELRHRGRLLSFGWPHPSDAWAAAREQVGAMPDPTHAEQLTPEAEP